MLDIMSFSIGIVGLPNVGKSTLFKALTRQEIAISPRPFTTINPNLGEVSVPDIRLEKIAKIVKPEKTTPTTIEFVDIAGLVKDAHKGAGLGNQFLGHIKPCEAIIEIVRLFKDLTVEHATGTINPEKDIDIIDIELLMKDLEVCEKLLKKLGKKKDKRFNILKKIQGSLLQEKPIRKLNLTEEEKGFIKEFQFLTEKPTVYLLNKNSKSKVDIGEFERKLPHSLNLDLKLEEEISQLTEKEREELKLSSELDKVILNCYNILDLITFFTIAGGKEAKAWTVKKGTKCAQAGASIHTDFEKKFIRAEVVPWEKLVEAQSWKKARESGYLKIAGRDYVVQDGDVIEFKI